MSTVLLVDDDLDARGPLAELLRNRGLDVQEANDGAGALEALETLHPALVVTDLTMPRMGGRALFEEMRRRPELAGIPVVVLSATPCEIGADRYFAKPCRFGEVWGAVRELMKLPPAPAVV